MNFTFTIEGDPVAKERPRHTGKVIYTPKKTLQAEKNIAIIARQAAQKAGWKKAEAGEPIYLGVTFTFKMPKNLSQKKSLETFLMPCTKRPDIDNIIKLLCDGINQAKNVWHDDSQVTELYARKTWGQTGSTIVTVNNFDGAKL